MILKTKALNSLFFLLITVNAGAEGFNTFDCLRDLMPLTEHGNYQKKRVGIERPFVADKKFIVFPEVTARKVTGFFVYDGKGAYFYDTVEIKSGNGVKATPIAALEEVLERPVYQMVAQPGGLETMTIYYMAGFKVAESNGNGPVALGTSVLPVIGAFVSRPERYDYVYQSPQDMSENRLQESLAKNRGGRVPASVGDQKVVRKMVSLATRSKREEKALWAPLKEELRMRRNWVQEHNIDNATFVKIRRAMDTSCKE